MLQLQHTPAISLLLRGSARLLLRLWERLVLAEEAEKLPPEGQRREQHHEGENVLPLLKRGRSCSRTQGENPRPSTRTEIPNSSRHREHRACFIARLQFSPGVQFLRRSIQAFRSSARSSSGLHSVSGVAEWQAGISGHSRSRPSMKKPMTMASRRRECHDWLSLGIRGLAKGTVEAEFRGTT